MEELLVYQLEYNLLRDAYLGNKEMLQRKLNYLVNMAQEEQWDYKGSTDRKILYMIKIWNCLLIMNILLMITMIDLWE